MCELRVVYINVLKVPLMICSKHQQYSQPCCKLLGALPPPFATLKVPAGLCELVFQAL